ncbi:hypothetical protein [Actinophytocola sp.]|uniref:hypothetical protein n=1 Tax=Actinophytocola sp. TaxID=1872138 RepID=UPI003D6B6931
MHASAVTSPPATRTTDAGSAPAETSAVAESTEPSIGAAASVRPSSYRTTNTSAGPAPSPPDRAGTSSAGAPIPVSAGHGSAALVSCRRTVSRNDSWSSVSRIP